jgi:hypothetical protein
MLTASPLSTPLRLGGAKDPFEGWCIVPPSGHHIACHHTRTDSQPRPPESVELTGRAGDANVGADPLPSWTPRGCGSTQDNARPPSILGSNAGCACWVVPSWLEHRVAERGTQARSPVWLSSTYTPSAGDNPNPQAIGSGLPRPFSHQFERPSCTETRKASQMYRGPPLRLATVFLAALLGAAGVCCCRLVSSLGRPP